MIVFYKDCIIIVFAISGKSLVFSEKIAEDDIEDVVTHQVLKAIRGCVSRRWHFLARAGDNKSPQFRGKEPAVRLTYEMVLYFPF